MLVYMFSTLCLIGLWYSLQGTQRKPNATVTMTDLYSMKYQGYWQMTSGMTQNCIQSEIMRYGQLLSRMKRQRLSITFESMNGTMFRTIPHVAANLYMTQTLCSSWLSPLNIFFTKRGTKLPVPVAKNLEEKVNPSILKDNFSSKTDPSIFTLIAPVLLDQLNVTS